MNSCTIAELIEAIQFSFGDSEFMARDLSLAFVLVAIVSSLSVFIFVQAQAGRRGRSVGPDGLDQRGPRDCSSGVAGRET